MIAGHFKGANIELVGPAKTVGGVILAYEVARQFGVKGIFAEREGDKRVFRRGFAIAPGERVLVVDDVVTTGGSVAEVIEEVRRKNGVVVTWLLVNRGKGKVDLGVPTFGVCYELSIPNYAPENCPRCGRYTHSKAWEQHQAHPMITGRPPRPLLVFVGPSPALGRAHRPRQAQTSSIPPFVPRWQILRQPFLLKQRLPAFRELNKTPPKCGMFC